MIVISDTTPLITLLKIDRLDLLQKLYDEIKIPNSVFEELTINNLFLEESEKIKNCDFLKIVSVSDREKVNFIQKTTGLDLGESEALVLCDELKSDLLLIDEVKGRFVAKQLGFSITGAVGILTFAYKSNFVTADEMKKYVEILRESRKSIGEKLLNGLLELVNQK